MSDLMKSLVYVTGMEYPNQKAHSIQITRTAVALSRLTNVYLVVSRLSCETPALAEEVRQRYGVDLGEGVRVIPTGHRHVRGPVFVAFLLKLLRLVPEDFAFYTRSYRVARRLLRYRWFHRKKILFESHKKAGYLKEDPVEGSPYASIRADFEATNEDRGLIEAVYRGADCVFFLHKHSMELVRSQIPLRDADFLWYGLGAFNRAPSAERPEEFMYCGGLAPNKLVGLVLEALRLTTRVKRLDIFGGTPNQLQELETAIRSAGLEGKVRLMGYRPFAQLREEMGKYRYGLATLEGIKVADYVEAGCVPIIPRIPSYTDVFLENDVRFFQADRADDLARVLDDSATFGPSNDGLKRVSDAYSLGKRVDKIVARLCG